MPPCPGLDRRSEWWGSIPGSASFMLASVVDTWRSRLSSCSNTRVDFPDGLEGFHISSQVVIIATPFDSIGRARGLFDRRYDDLTGRPGEGFTVRNSVDPIELAALRQEFFHKDSVKYDPDQRPGDRRNYVSVAFSVRGGEARRPRGTSAHGRRVLQKRKRMLHVRLSQKPAYAIKLLTRPQQAYAFRAGTISPI